MDPPSERSLRARRRSVAVPRLATDRGTALLDKTIDRRLRNAVAPGQSGGANAAFIIDTEPTDDGLGDANALFAQLDPDRPRRPLPLSA